MSNYSSQIQKHVYNNLGEIEDQLGEVTTSDVQSEVRRTLEENYFYAPEFCYNSELLEIIVDHDLEDPDDVCFYGVESAMEAVKREAEAIVDATYHAYLNTALGELEEALEDGVDILEGMGLEVESINGGSAGYDDCVHSEEHDVGNSGNMFLWRTYNVAQIDINGMSFKLSLAEPEEDEEDDQESE